MYHMYAVYIYAHHLCVYAHLSVCICGCADVHAHTRGLCSNTSLNSWGVGCDLWTRLTAGSADCTLSTPSGENLRPKFRHSCDLQTSERKTTRVGATNQPRAWGLKIISFDWLKKCFFTTTCHILHKNERKPKPCVLLRNTSHLLVNRFWRYLVVFKAVLQILNNCFPFYRR